MPSKLKVFYDVVRFFKKEYPPKYPLSVRRVKMKTMNGSCLRKYNPNTFRIRLSNELSQEHLIETFIHEYAHLIILGRKDGHGEHNHEWGRIYAELHRAYEAKFC